MFLVVKPAQYITLSGVGWWVLSKFPNFPLSDHGVHLKILQTPRLRYISEKCPSYPVFFKVYFGKKSINPVLLKYILEVHFIKCFLRYILEKYSFYEVLFKAFLQLGEWLGVSPTLGSPCNLGEYLGGQCWPLGGVVWRI